MLYLLTIINLFPARIIANLTAGVDNQTLSKDFLIYEILLPFLLTIGLIYFV